MKRASNVIIITLMALWLPAAAQAQSSSWTPGHDGPQVDSSSYIEEAMVPWIPATLAITFHTGLAVANVYCIAKRNCGSFRYVGIALGYGIGALDGLVGALNLASGGQDREARVVGYTALGLAALNISLGLWNHLTPQRTSIEKRLRITPTMLRDSSGGSGPGLLLARRF